MMQYICYAQLLNITYIEHSYTCTHSQSCSEREKNGNSSIDFNFILNSHESVSSVAVLCCALFSFTGMALHQQPCHKQTSKYQKSRNKQNQMEDKLHQSTAQSTCVSKRKKKQYNHLCQK